MAERQMIDYIFYSLIFPGLIFLLLFGSLVSWIDRKVTAKIQWRQGPSILQPFYDVRKLFLKETIIPVGGNKTAFILAPAISFLSIILISNILIVTWMYPQKGFIGDLIVLIYLLVVPSLSAIIGASASNSPYAALGASREMKSMMAYELPFIISILIPIIKTKDISLGQIIMFQQANGSFIFSLSGILAFLAALLCMHAKLGIVPFDMAEAETELAGGYLAEYSGPLLAVWKMAKMMLLVIGPLFVIAMYFGGGNVVFIALKYLLIVVMGIIVKNTNPRLRVDQALKFFWFFVTGLALLALILAIFGY
ncbi:respiratory chain complex I subunit 1 family protein [Elusimicrobiota bacterium]